ncbi:sulfite exporter TauE/SafE family protein, partial [Rhizobiaceae sp. 2RAB30]
VWAVPVVVGVALGSIVARYAEAELFKAVFVAVAGVSALRLLFGKDSWNVGTSMPGRALMIFYGWIIGLLSALMGIGGGQLSSLFMTFYGRPIHQAVATSSGLGILISVPGALGYIYAGWPRAAEYPDVAALQPPLALGYVSLIGLVAFIPTSTLAAPLGARIAHTLSKRQLEIAFGLFLLFVCARFLIDLVD